MQQQNTQHANINRPACYAEMEKVSKECFRYIERPEAWDLMNFFYGRCKKKYDFHDVLDSAVLIVDNYYKAKGEKGIEWV